MAIRAAYERGVSEVDDVLPDSASKPGGDLPCAPNTNGLAVAMALLA